MNQLLEPHRHRRRGVRRVLARAAAARCTGYALTANPPDAPHATAFWARVGSPRAPARPCSHQEPPG